MCNDNRQSMSPCIVQAYPCQYTRMIVVIFLNPFAILNMEYRFGNRVAADEYCSVLLLNRKLQMDGDTTLAELLGLETLDRRWLSPDGRNCTRRMESACPADIMSQATDDGLCVRWSLDGWVLAKETWDHLNEKSPAKAITMPMLKKKTHRLSNSRCFKKKTGSSS